MKTRMFLVLLGVALATSCTALMKKNPYAKEWDVKCKSSKSLGSSVQYCVHTKTDSPKYTILYLHGAGDTEQTFVKSFYAFDSFNSFMAANEDARLVTISFHENALNDGFSWMLTPFAPRTKDPKKATVENVVKKLLPEIGIQSPIHVMGISMGGANTATLCLSHPELFKSCTLINPMVVTCDPYRDAFTKCLPSPIIKGNFTESEWKTGSPTALLEKATTLPPIFLAAAQADEFKLYEATLALKAAFELKKTRLTWIDAGPGSSHFNWPHEAISKFIKDNNQ